MAGEKTATKKPGYFFTLDKNTREIKGECFLPHNRICVECDSPFRHPKRTEFQNTCPACLKDGIKCPHCQALVRKEENKKTVGGVTICIDCYKERYAECDHCKIEGDKLKFEIINKKHYCKKCNAALFATCERCNAKEKKDKLRPYKDDVSTFAHLCKKCYDKAEKYIGLNPLVNVKKSKIARRLEKKYVQRER